MAERHRRAGAIARAAFVASLLLAASPAVSSGAQDEDAAQRTAGAMPWSALDADEQRMLAPVREPVEGDHPGGNRRPVSQSQGQLHLAAYDGGRQPVRDALQAHGASSKRDESA